MNVTSDVHPHVTGHECESKPPRRLGKRGLGSYLARQGTVYIFQIRLPKKLGGTADMPPVRLSLGPCAYQQARYLADILAAEARLFCEGLRALDTSDDTHFPIQPQDLLTEETPEHNLVALKTYMKIKHHEIRSSFDPRSPSQKAAMDAIKGIVRVRSEARKRETGEPFNEVIVDNADLLIDTYSKKLTASVSPESVASATSDQTVSVAPLQPPPVLPSPPAVAPPSPPAPPRPAGPVNVPFAVWVKPEELKNLGKRVPDVLLDRRYVPRPPSTAPLFSEVADEYLSARAGANEGDNKDIGTARKRLKLFIDVIGDHPADTYTFTDLQAYTNAIQYLPAKLSARAEEDDPLQLIKGNLDRSEKTLALKTIRDGYVTVVKTAIRTGATEHNYRYPLTDLTIRYPRMAERSRPTQPMSYERINAVFRTGVSSGLMEDVMLPLLGHLTGRRLGLLVHIYASDIVEKYPGVWIVDTTSIRRVDGKLRRIPLKTDASLTFFVLHDKLKEIGFIDWAVSQGEQPLFPNLMSLTDPSKSGSQYMGRLFAKAGVPRGRREVFHSLRGGQIEEMRDHEVDARSRKLQAGHEIGSDEHELYGFRSLTEHKARSLARLKLNPEIDFSVFEGLDFEAISKNTRQEGRRWPS